VLHDGMPHNLPVQSHKNLALGNYSTVRVIYIDPYVGSCVVMMLLHVSGDWQVW